MTPEMEAAAWEGLATNRAAQIAAEGHAFVADWLTAHDQVAISRERLAELERRANRDPGDGIQPLAGEGLAVNAGLLAFIVRDLMTAAGYTYDPDRPLAEQARECDQIIRHHRQQLLGTVELAFSKTQEEHDAEVRRLTDLVDELRKQLLGFHGATERAVTSTLKLAAGKIRARSSMLDGLGDQADLEQLAAYVECPCRPGAPAHEHGTGGYQLDAPATQDGPE